MDSHDIAGTAFVAVAVAEGQSVVAAFVAAAVAAASFAADYEIDAAGVETAGSYRCQLAVLGIAAAAVVAAAAAGAGIEQARYLQTDSVLGYLQTGSTDCLCCRLTNRMILKSPTRISRFPWQSARRARSDWMASTAAWQRHIADAAVGLADIVAVADACRTSAAAGTAVPAGAARLWQLLISATIAA